MQTRLKLSQESCKHAVDESTKTFDTMKGWRGVCKHCGAKVSLVRFVDAKRDRPKNDSKKARRRLRKQIKEATRGQQQGAKGDALVTRITRDAKALDQGAQQARAEGTPVDQAT